MSKSLPPLSQDCLKGICQIMAHTETGYTGHQIGMALEQLGIMDVNPEITKWKRLYNAFAEYQNKNQISDRILNFCKNYFNPQRFVNDNRSQFNEQRVAFNRFMIFDGWEINERGTLRRLSKKVETLSEADERASLLKIELENRNTHSQVLRFCKPELMNEDYFHVVEESLKGLFERIREISCVYNEDGATLIDKVFNQGNPMVIINPFDTKSEVSQHKGFAAMLKAMYSLFRNPEAHTPREKWPVGKQDALEILGMISYCHRILDNAQCIRRQ